MTTFTTVRAYSAFSAPAPRLADIAATLQGRTAPIGRPRHFATGSPALRRTPLA